MRKSFFDWMSSIAHISARHCLDPESVYHGVDGCKRLAKECGCAIPDFTLDEKEQDNLISSTYSAICVIAYGLNPPVNANKWFEWMRIGRDNAMECRKNAIRKETYSS